MKQKRNKLVKLKRAVTKKQLLFISSIVLIIIVGGVIWGIHTINMVALNTSPAPSKTGKSGDTKIDKIAPTDITDGAKSTNKDASNNVTQKTATVPQTPTPQELCAKGTYNFDNDTLQCTYSINIIQAPSRLVVFAVETSPIYIQMYEEVSYNVICAKPTVCTNESAPSTPSRIQMAISEPTVVTVSVKQTTSYGSPTKIYSFQQWELTQGGVNYGDGSYPYTLLGKFKADS